MVGITVCLLVISILQSCADQGVSPEDRRFNILLRYGVSARNELNTFQNKYTKDLILDGSITVPFVLSPSELQIIESKLLEADFFNYPDTFVIQTQDTVIGYHAPFSTFYFNVRRDSRVKTLYWADGIVSPTEDHQATRLRALIRSITDLIEAKPEYQQLPEPRGYYI